jgi:hypothetical protein
MQVKSSFCWSLDTTYNKHRQPTVIINSGENATIGRSTFEVGGISRKKTLLSKSFIQHEMEPMHEAGVSNG